MAAPLSLTPDEVELREEIESWVKQVRSFFSMENRGLPESDFNEAESRMGDLAHRLHMLLKKRGLEPRHHRYMVKNRGMQPDDPEFYKHIHPTEDLLKFLDDPSANDDPEDQTIGETFEFRVYSRRWGHEDTYRLTRTGEGWRIRFMEPPLDCDKGGRPYVFQQLDHDSIVYPRDLDGFFEWLWERAREKGLSKERVQEAITQLADWVSQTERSVPGGDVWRGYC